MRCGSVGWRERDEEEEAGAEEGGRDELASPGSVRSLDRISSELSHTRQFTHRGKTRRGKKEIDRYRSTRLDWR